MNANLHTTFQTSKSKNAGYDTRQIRDKLREQIRRKKHQRTN